MQFGEIGGVALFLGLGMHPYHFRERHGLITPHLVEDDVGWQARACTQASQQLSALTGIDLDPKGLGGRLRRGFVLQVTPGITHERHDRLTVRTLQHRRARYKPRRVPLHGPDIVNDAATLLPPAPSHCFIGGLPASWSSWRGGEARRSHSGVTFRRVVTRKSLVRNAGWGRGYHYNMASLLERFRDHVARLG